MQPEVRIEPVKLIANRKKPQTATRRKKVSFGTRKRPKYAETITTATDVLEDESSTIEVKMTSVEQDSDDDHHNDGSYYGDDGEMEATVSAESDEKIVSHIKTVTETGDAQSQVIVYIRDVRGNLYYY